MKGIPKQDGTGKGIRANKGRGGCDTTRSTGQGKNKSGNSYRNRVSGDIKINKKR